MKSVFCPICVSLCLFRIQPFSVCALILQKNILLNLNVLAMKLKNFLKKAICSVPIVVVRSILLLCIYLSLGLVARAATQQRKITVSGIVTDSSGEPVIGASITEKGTSNGTISDVKGHFGISVSSTAILQISFIGYRTEEVTASPAKTSLKVILR